MSKVKKPVVKKWTVWYDPILASYYVVVGVYKNSVKILWLDCYSDFPSVVSLTSCEDDSFVRILSPLERELL